MFDDLGTPLLLDVNKMLAPQAYLRITSIGISDPMGYVISVILIAFSLLSLYVSLMAMKGKDYATAQKGGGGLSKRDLKLWEKVATYALVLFILLIVLSPHLGLLLLSFGTVWSFAVLPDGYTFAHYIKVASEASQYITNTLMYAGIAALFDVILGTAIAYIVFRTKLTGRKWLDYGATMALAVPGVVLGIGYLRTFYSVDVPFIDQPLAHLVGDHRDRLDSAPFALCSALLCGGRSSRLAPCSKKQLKILGATKGTHGDAHCRAADEWWHSGWICHQFCHQHRLNYRPPSCWYHENRMHHWPLASTSLCNRLRAVVRAQRLA